MTPQSPEAVPPAVAVEDFSNLYPRQTGLGVYRVLHVKEDETSTHYKVDINSGECDCMDSQMNRGEGEACKHLAAAIYQASKHISAEDVAVNNLVGVVRDARDSADELQRVATGVKADIAHAATESDTADAEETVDVDPVDAVEDWLEGEGVSPGKLDVWDQGGSVQIETEEQLDDDEFAVLRDTDWIWYDAEENRNFVTEDNLAEVM